MRHEAGDALAHGLPQVQSVVVLVLRRIPLLNEAARVHATSMLWVGAVQAEVVRRAHDTQGLVPCDVRGETAQVRRHIQAANGGHIVLHVALPAQPPSMSGIEVDGRARGCLRDSLHSIADATTVRGHGRGAAATRVRLVCGQVRQRVRLDDKHDRHETLEMPQNTGDLVDVLRAVLIEACRAIPSFDVVTTAIFLVCAADLAIRGLRVTIAIRKVVHDEHHQLRRALAGCILQDALHGIAAFSQDLRFAVKPKSRRHAAHAFKRALHLILGSGD
mmetsp:Transcript_61174/g.164574  ORF Transcript_61174/g.164574 Transcript_61174/m.164574 type:complete len:275 (-) Transcript_61174:544-1368(-)